MQKTPIEENCPFIREDYRCLPAARHVVLSSALVGLLLKEVMLHLTNVYRQIIVVLCTKTRGLIVVI